MREELKQLKRNGHKVIKSLYLYYYYYYYDYHHYHHHHYYYSNYEGYSYIRFTLQQAQGVSQSVDSYRKADVHIQTH